MQKNGGKQPFVQRILTEKISLGYNPEFDTCESKKWLQIQ